MSDVWSRKLFVALLRRYDIKPYRYYRQRYTTVMAKISKTFVDETLWPEFEELNKTLKEYLEEITNKVISESIYSDSSEAEVIQQLN
jgi:tRNA nucleotidyltransferase (CCA-adding enzyme)